MIGGLVWGVVLLASVATSVTVLAVIVTPVCLLGAATAWRAARRAADRPAVIGGGVLLAGVALVGLAPVAGVVSGVVGVVVLVGGAVAFGWATVLADSPDEDTLSAAGLLTSGAGWQSVLAAVLPGVAGLTLVVATEQSNQAALVLVLAVCAFDAANALMGTGDSGGVVGAVAGVLSVAVLAVIVESVLVPPFTPSGVWLLCGAVAVAAPIGVLGCWRLVPGRVPALRRLDSLVLAGPVWIAGASVLVHH